MNDDIIKAVCAAVVLGEGENYEPVHLEPREARQAIAAYHAALAARPAQEPVACPGADDPEDRCPRHPSECACWQVDTDHPMMQRAAPQPLHTTNCCKCGRIIDTREKKDGGDDFGVQLSDKRWTCSIECWDAVVDPQPAHGTSATERVPSGVVESLDERMKAAGMFTVAEMMGVTTLTRWTVQAGMTDLDFFSEWLDRKVAEYLRMKAAYDLGDKDERDELYEWVLAHAGAYSSIRENFRAARAAIATPTPKEESK